MIAKIRDKKFICAHCDEAFTRKGSLKSHLFSSCPRLKIIKPKVPGVEILEFNSHEEFLLWKDHEEQQSCSKFSQSCGKRQTKRCEKTNYLCHRSGRIRLKEPSLKKRLLKSKGSCKINTKCTAFILTEKYPDGTVLVQYNKTHSNHPIEMKHLPLSHRDKEEFANKLKKGMSMDEILDELRNTMCDSQSFTRKHLITKHDLHNIRREFNITYTEPSSSEDTASVELLIDQYEKNYGTESPFLYYKQQGVEDTTFEKYDFLLIMMNPTQISFLQKYGPDKVCIDSIHCSTESDFLLNSIVVVDDLNLGIPVAHMISNKENTVFLKKFFEVVKTKSGVINTKTFISADFPAYINAWEEVMGFVNNRLLCGWHVDRNWRENLTLIRDVEGSGSVTVLRKEVHNAIRTVMEETNQSLFPEIVDSVVQSLENDPATKDFGAYFKREYSNRYRMWANAFRRCNGINTYMTVELVHRDMKTLCTKGTKTKRLHSLITALLRMNRNKVHARMTQLLMEADFRTARRIRNRHKESLEIPKEDIVVVSDEVALITSQSNRHTCYTITKATDSCDCQLRCSECDSVCVHMYFCTCADNTIKHNFCKHIHAFIKVRSSTENYVLDDITNVEIVVDVNKSDNYEEINDVEDGVQILIQSTYSLDCEKNIRDEIKSIIQQLHPYAENIGDGEGNELQRKALYHLQEALKLMQMNEKSKKKTKIESKSPSKRKLSKKKSLCIC